MHLLLIGYSNFAQRRLLPALTAMGETQVDVASRTRAADITMPPGLLLQVFDAYETALAQSQAEIVYVSTRNHDHAEWTETALRRGFHVIVDKPAFTRLSDARRLVELARQQGRCLAEATVYAYHPQIQMAKDLFAKVDSAPTHLNATFSFPPLAADNFRYTQACDGGALWDLGPYAITPGRLFFGVEPETITCRVTASTGDVDSAFSVLATYGGGHSMVGHFGYTTDYRNHLDILGPDATVRIDRVFTTPPELANTLVVTQRNQPLTAVAPPCDQVMAFLQQVAEAIDTGEHNPFARTLMADAMMLDRLRRAAGVVT